MKRQLLIATIVVLGGCDGDQAVDISTTGALDDDADSDADTDADSDADADTDSDTDADSDADTDADTDADSDSDSDTEPPTAVIYSSGTFQVNGTWYGDLDTGSQVSDATGDFWWEMQTDQLRDLSPLGGATFAVMGTNPLSYADCLVASTTGDPIDASGPNYHDLPVGTWVCAVTNQGRISAFNVVAIDPQQNHLLTLDYATWE